MSPLAPNGSFTSFPLSPFLHVIHRCAIVPLPPCQNAESFQRNAKRARKDSSGAATNGTPLGRDSKGNNKIPAKDDKSSVGAADSKAGGSVGVSGEAKCKDIGRAAARKYRRLRQELVRSLCRGQRMPIKRSFVQRVCCCI